MSNNYRPIYKSIFVLIFVFIILSSCLIDNSKNIPYGLQPNHSSYIPARIAIFPCQIWPNGARFKSLPISNVPLDDFNSLCRKLDDFALDGFKGQPYMKGFSPKAVSYLLAKANKKTNFKKINEYWKHLPKDCESCKTIPAFYSHSIANRSEWRIWLNDISKNVRNADAVLIPFITYAYNESFNDRGLLIEKRAALSVILILTQNLIT